MQRATAVAEAEAEEGKEGKKRRGWAVRSIEGNAKKEKSATGEGQRGSGFKCQRVRCRT